jgi:hypothetical protein
LSAAKVCAAPAVPVAAAPWSKETVVEGRVVLPRAPARPCAPAAPRAPVAPRAAARPAAPRLPAFAALPEPVWRTTAENGASPRCAAAEPRLSPPVNVAVTVAAARATASRYTERIAKALDRCRFLNFVIAEPPRRRGAGFGRFSV